MAHEELKALYAKDEQTPGLADMPWLLWEYQDPANGHSWTPIGGTPAWIGEYEYRRLPGPTGNCISHESDPLGKSPHQPGAKLDAGKTRMGLVLLGFSRAFTEVARVGTYGANKYTDDGWMEVPNGEQRYTDALLRHLMAEGTGQHIDPDTQLLHAAHAAWNALARLDLILREVERE